MQHVGRSPGESQSACCLIDEPIASGTLKNKFRAPVRYRAAVFLLPRGEKPTNHAMSTTEFNARSRGQESGNIISVPARLSDILRLPSELQICVFQGLPELWSAIALRLTCRHLNNIYLANEKRIQSSLVQRLVSPFYDYYKFLDRLHLPESSIVYPPPSGWPDITSEDYTHLFKTSFAIEVLRHLPYIQRTWDGRTNINTGCYVVDYSTYTQGLSNTGGEPYTSLKDVNYTMPEYVVLIAWGNVNGVELLLDTLSGTIYEMTVRGEVGGGHAKRNKRVGRSGELLRG